METSFLVISSSLNPQSRSRVLADRACEHLNKKAKVQFLDLADYKLPICDGDAAYGHESVMKLTPLVQEAGKIILATPIYNFDAGASAKNFIELTGKAWQDKIVGFLCAAGGSLSYMSIMGLANSLMLDFRCVIVPRFVFAVGSAFEGDRLTDREIDGRISELVQAMLSLKNM